jgi:anthranilate synthase component I
MMQAPFDIAADLDTPVSAFRKLSRFKPHFLLESVEGGERLGRYSFIGFGEATHLRLQGDSLWVDGVERAAPTDRAGVLAAFRAAMDLAPKLRPEVPSLPFSGGLVGAASYDIVRRFEPVSDTPLPPDAPPDALFTAPQSVLAFDHLSRRVALLHAGTEEERLALREEVIATLRGPDPGPRKTGKIGPPTPTIGRDEFLAAVDKIKGHIHAGDVFQLVLSIRMEGSCDLDPFEVYRALRLLNPSPYMVYMEWGETAIVGSSPEALVRLDGDSATLRPIAGTRKRGQSISEDRALEAELLSDEKETAEHVMLVDLARNDLGRVAVPGSVTVTPYRTIERYSHVMHTVSGVEGTLDSQYDAFDLFAATFPAGTVVGAPKVKAMQLIDDLEPVHRGIYAGTVGYFGHGGGMDQAIAIRTLVFEKGRYAYQAGAGIVADSVAESEHKECHAKAAALGAALRLAEEGL